VSGGLLPLPCAIARESDQTEPEQRQRARLRDHDLRRRGVGRRKEVQRQVRRIDCRDDFQIELGQRRKVGAGSRGNAEGSKFEEQ
jgi:hypothetical protein